MKLDAQIRRKVTNDLIIRINELYHNLENEVYKDRHSEWHHFESDIFRSTAKKHLKRSERITCLDYGSGTGFVPLAIGPCLKPEDVLICTDLSKEILNVCRNNLETKKFPFKIEYLKLYGQGIPVEDRSIDVITANSVLHHILKLKKFASECHRVLKKREGVLVVGHEPNGDRNLPIIGKLIYVLNNIVFNPSNIVYEMVDRSRWLENILRSLLSKISDVYRRRNKMLTEIAYQLQEEGLIDQHLRGVEIQQLVDYHTEFGFKRKHLMNEVFQGFHTLQWNTFNHLSKSSYKNSITRAINHSMARRWPMHGTTLNFVLQRI